MTILINFTPNNLNPFQFFAVLDGNNSTVQIKWNLFSQKYYLYIYGISNNLILVRSVVGSPNGFDINLISGFFKTSSIVYRSSTNNFEIN